MPGRCGISSRQWVRSGVASGAVAMRKSIASPWLVRMKSSSPRSGRCSGRRPPAPRRRGVGARQVDQPALAVSWLPVATMEKRPVALSSMRPEPAAVLFLVDQDVVALRRAQAMAVDLQRPVVLVEPDIEEERGIVPPHDVAAGLLDDVGQVFAGLPASHADGEIFRAAQIGAPGFETMVRRMLRLAEIEILRRLGQRVAVEDDPGIAAVARRAADQLVLPAFAIFPPDRRTDRPAPARPRNRPP